MNVSLGFAGALNMKGRPSRSTLTLVPAAQPWIRHEVPGHDGGESTSSVLRVGSRTEEIDSGKCVTGVGARPISPNIHLFGCRVGGPTIAGWLVCVILRCPWPAITVEQSVLYHGVRGFIDDVHTG